MQLIYLEDDPRKHGEGSGKVGKGGSSSDEISQLSL